MVITDQAKGFVSLHYDWDLSLPLGWKVLPKMPIEFADFLNDIEVFAHPYDPSLTMTWLRSRNEIERELWQRFTMLTMTVGLIPPGEAQELMNQIFPLMGRAASAFAVTTADGQRALEVTEEIPSSSSGAELMRGYHLVFPVRSKKKEQLLMQQIVFYARASKFAVEIVDVIRSARSFRHL